ncbi:MAG: SDR family oxidoreductase [Hyphomicrobiales bacterium]|nr:SDR family oxidoreductase [Hyphomicrobiales bacterium]
MTEWLRRLETAWMRRNAPRPAMRVTNGEGLKPVCVITGASEGIGRELANEFAARGHCLLLVARNEAALDTAANELARDHHVTAHVLAADLTEPDYLEKIQGVVNREGLYVDILVNNAAFGLGGPFTEQEPKRIEDLCRLNVETLTMLTRRFLPEMVERARGGVLNVASLGGILPGPYQAAYYASKAYVISLTEALAHENAGRGVRICAAAPGPVGTRFHEKMGVAGAFYLKLLLPMSPARAARIIHSGFAGRRTIIVPGLLASLNAFWARIVPHAVLTPLIGWILKQRY